MSVRRTKKQKQQAELRRLEHNYQWSDASSSSAIGEAMGGFSLVTGGRERTLPDASKLLRYPASFIYRDLLKTVVTTAVIFLLLAAIAWRGGWV